MNWNCYLDGSFDRVDTKIFHKKKKKKKMFGTCDGVSPNLRLCYRVLKFIRNYFKTAENYQMERLVNYTVYIHSIYLTKYYLENLLNFLYVSIERIASSFQE